MDHTVTCSQVKGIVRRKHEHFNRYFCTCSVAMLAGVSEMRVSDARFTSTYDKNNPGLAQFWHDAQCHTRVLKWGETTHSAFLTSSSSS